jgi:hypothetical protein
MGKYRSFPFERNLFCREGLFDAKDLETVLSRPEKPFLKPTLPHEVSGQYAAGYLLPKGWFIMQGKMVFILWNA